MRAGISKEHITLIVDSLLSAVILLPVLMATFAAYALETTFASFGLVTITLIWAISATAALMSRLYKPHKTALLRCTITKGLLLRIFQSLAVALITVLGIGVWIGTLDADLGLRLFMLFAGGVLLLGLSAVTIAIPALAQTTFLAHEFSIVRILRMAKWAWRKSPLAAITKVLLDVLIGAGTWIPVVLVLGAINVATSNAPGWELSLYKLPLLAVITTALIAAAHCGAVFAQHASRNH